MDISVVIPTFNRREMVCRAIESVLNQSHPAAEILVVDDGSTDDTSTCVAKLFPTIKLIAQENKGVSAARNVGICHSQNEWIAFLDSDDEWKQNKLACQVKELTKFPESQICHTDEIWIRNGKRVNPMKKHAKPNGRIFSDCLPLCCVSPSSVMVKKELLVNAGLFDETLPACEDYDLWLRLFSQHEILFVKGKLVIKTGGHNDQLSQKYWGMDRFRVKALIGLLENFKLNDQDRADTIDMLLSKINILINGFQKRKNQEMLSYYQDLYSQWSAY